MEENPPGLAVIIILAVLAIWGLLAFIRFTVAFLSHSPSTPDSSTKKDDSSGEEDHPLEK